MSKISKEYNEIFVIDTNIVLNDANSIEVLSQSSKNLIVIPETVLDELDSKKSGFSEIAYQARKFGRILSDADVIDVERIGSNVFTLINLNHGKNINVLIVSKERYLVNTEDTDSSIKNDRKILEIAQDVKSKYGKCIFISQDVMARHRAISLGIDTEPFNLVEEEDVVLYSKFSLDGTDLELKNSYTLDEIIETLCTDTFGLTLHKNGIYQHYYRVSKVYIKIDEDELKKQNIKPRNVEQKILSSMFLEPSYDVVVVDAPAGSGKTATALSVAMRLMDSQNKNNSDEMRKFDKIVYIRKTVISDQEELGFLPGTQEEKISPYLAPLYSNLEYIAREKYKNKKEKLTKDAIETSIKELIDKYDIQTMYQGFLRGTNIRNAIVILDEFQNDTISSAKTVLSRLDENCRAFVIGSTKQIDNKFVSKSSNALTFLLSKVYKDNDEVRLGGMTLTEVVRSRIAKWADDF